MEKPFKEVKKMKANIEDLEKDPLYPSSEELQNKWVDLQTQLDIFLSDHEMTEKDYELWLMELDQKEKEAKNNNLQIENNKNQEDRIEEFFK